MVIDQERGRVGDWETASNFMYDGAAELLQILSDNHLHVDVNRDGSVRTGSIMHDKFFTIDSRRVWLGSTNLTDTESGAEYNANSSILIESSELAEIYDREFHQMFGERRFSIYKTSLHQPMLNFADGTELEVYFSPQDRPISRAVVPFIQAARVKLDIAMFYLTSAAVRDALIAAAKRGVDVRIINDATAARNQYSQTNGYALLA